MRWFLWLVYDFCSAVGFFGMAVLFAAQTFSEGELRVPVWAIIAPAMLCAVLIGQFYRWPKERAALRGVQP